MVYRRSMKNKVKSIIDLIYPIAQRSFQKIECHLIYEAFKKGETFIKKNRRNEKEYFVIDGICKSYLINPEGEEITISFFLQRDILSPNQVRTSRGTSNLNFKALTDLQLASINADTFEKLMIEDIEIRNFANTVLQNELVVKVQKEIGLASLTAKERLLAFRKQYKALENLIPHTDIASYLGITNISLSRIRKELMH